MFCICMLLFVYVLYVTFSDVNDLYHYFLFTEYAKLTKLERYNM